MVFNCNWEYGISVCANSWLSGVTSVLVRACIEAAVQINGVIVHSAHVIQNEWIRTSSLYIFLLRR